MSQKVEVVEVEVEVEVVLLVVEVVDVAQVSALDVGQL